VSRGLLDDRELGKPKLKNLESLIRNSGNQEGPDRGLRAFPDQLRIYQMHIAQLKRIYYLDVPASYAKLNEVFPPLSVKPFGHFFAEADTLLT